SPRPAVTWWRGSAPSTPSARTPRGCTARPPAPSSSPACWPTTGSQAARTCRSWSVWRRSRRRLRPSAWSGSRGPSPRSPRSRPWCGQLDTSTSNIMRAADGHLVLINPYYADGPHLYALAAQEPARFVTTTPAEARRHLTEIPLADSGPWPVAEREAMARAVREADARQASTSPRRDGRRPIADEPAADARAAEELIAQAAAASVDGWGFAHLDGRATEERPPWGYSALLAEAVAQAEVAVDLGTG